MLKRAITYEDFDGNEHTEDFYFNLSKTDLIEMEFELEEGFGEFLQKIVDTKDNKELIKQFKKIILMSYGVKSEDGKRFIKSDELREAFSQTAAFEQLFVEMATIDGVAADFAKGIMPKDFIALVEEEEKKRLAEEKAALPQTAINTGQLP